MRTTLVVVALLLGAILLSPATARRRAHRTPCVVDSAITAVLDAVEVECDCTGSTNHSSFVRCAGQSAKRRATAGELPKSCVSKITKGAATSSCGRVGFVTCCLSDAHGKTTCHVRQGAASCHKQGTAGSACIASRPSCLDACTTTGCR